MDTSGSSEQGWKVICLLLANETYIIAYLQLLTFYPFQMTIVWLLTHTNVQHKHINEISIKFNITLINSILVPWTIWDLCARHHKTKHRTCGFVCTISLSYKVQLTIADNKQFWIKVLIKTLRSLSSLLKPTLINGLNQHKPIDATIATQIVIGCKEFNEISIKHSLQQSMIA